MKALITSIALGITLLTMIACASAAPVTVPAASPSPVPATLTATPLPPTASPPPTATAPPTVTPVPPTSTPIPSFAGDWLGKTSQSNRVIFQVQGTAVTAIYIDLVIDTPNCKVVTGYTYGRPAPIAVNSFQIQDGPFTVAGTFDDASSASGTLKLKEPYPPCGDVDLQVNWSAKRNETTAEKSVEMIRRDGELTIRSNGDVQFVETWDVQFKGGPFFSTWRAIPTKGTGGIDNWSVSDDGFKFKAANTGEAETFEISDDSGQSKITWHIIPAIDEERAFTLGYTVHSALQAGDTGSELLWKFIEADRGYPITSAHVVVHLPRLFPLPQLQASAFLDGKRVAGGRVVDGQTLEYIGGPFPPSSEWTLGAQFPEVGAAPPAFTPEAGDPVAVIQSMFQAINNGDVEAALANVDENVAFAVGGYSETGKDNLRSYLTTRIAAGIRYTVSNFRTVGTVVSFAADESGTSYPLSSAVVVAGKIRVLTLK